MYDSKFIWDWIYPKLKANRISGIERRFSEFLKDWDIKESRRLTSEKDRNEEIPIYSGIFRHYMEDLYSKFDTTLTYEDINSDTIFANIIPAGYMLQYVIIEEKTGNLPVLSLGTTTDGYDIFNQVETFSNSITVNTLNVMFSFDAATTLYLSDTRDDGTWDSSTINIHFVIKQIK